jgi:FecR protein/C-lobe and N-lobe beta barrels of Tf-binding protein B
MQFFIRLLIFFMIGTPLLQAAIGKITALSGNASLERGINTIPAALGSSLEAKDSIVTDNDAKVQLTFNDNTIITVGKKSRFSIEEYLYDATAESTAKFNMINGTIRAMSGKIGKIAPAKFAVKTKTATIGIRGTDFIVQTSATGESQFFCMQGEITIRSNDTSGIITIPAGSFVTMSSSGIVSEVKEFTPAELNTILKNSLSVSSVHTSEKTTQIETNTPDEAAADPLLKNNSQTTINLNDTLAATIQNTVIGSVSSAIPRIGFAGQVYTTTSGSDYGTWLVPLDVAYAVDDAAKIFLPGSGLKLYSDLLIPLNKPTNMVSADVFETTFAPFSYTDINGYFIYYDATRPSENYFRTSADLDPNDAVTWGDWSLPVVKSNTDFIGQAETMFGYWLAGTATPTAVIDNYRNNNMGATYTGSLIGSAVESGSPLVRTNFTGTVTSDVNFGADTLNTTLSYSVKGDAYQVIINDTINGNKFGSTTSVATLNGNSSSINAGPSSGAFYGADGKTIGGYFGVSDNVRNRSMSGVYEAKTTTIAPIININNGNSAP